MGRMSRDLLQKTDPVLRNIPVCLNMWVPPKQYVSVMLCAEPVVLKLQPHFSLSIKKKATEKCNGSTFMFKHISRPIPYW